MLLLALAQDQHDQAIEAEQSHSGKRHDGEAVRRLRDAGSAGRCGRCLAGFGGAGYAVGSGIAVVAIAAIGFAGGCGRGLFRRDRGGFLGRGGLFLGLPAYGEGRQTVDCHDQLAILKGGLQQFGIAVVLQVGDKEVVVVCLLGLDVVGQVESDLQAFLREVFLGDFLADGAVLVLDPQRNFIEFCLTIFGGLFLGDLLFQGGLDLLGSGEALILQLLGDVVGGQFLLDDLGLDRCSRGGGSCGGLGCRGRGGRGSCRRRRRLRRSARRPCPRSGRLDQRGYPPAGRWPL